MILTLHSKINRLYFFGFFALLCSGLGLSPKLTQATTAVTATSLVQLVSGTNGQNAGRALVTGDVNNDGYDDLLIGGHAQANGGPGIAYLQYGQEAVLSSAIITDNTTAKFVGASANDRAGFALAMGDLDHDGYDDMVIGAKQDDDGGSNAGAIYIVYGQATTISPGAIPLSNYPKYVGEAANDDAGFSLAIGDLNHDSYDDIIVGARQNDDGGSNAGAVYIIYSSGTRLTAGTTTSLSTAIELTGESASAQAGTSVATADLNHDSYSDIIISAPAYNPGGLIGAGSVYVVYGQSTALTSGSLAGKVRYDGKAAGDVFGRSVAAGDINNDSMSDIVIGAPTNGSDDVGAAYVVYGQTSNLSGGSASLLPEFLGATMNDSTDYIFSVGVSDLNNDSYADIIVGDGNHTGANVGVVYVVNGQSSALTSGALTSLASSSFSGALFDDVFAASVTGGDLNNDNYNDLIIGAPGYTTNTAQGAAYIAYLAVDGDGDGTLGTSGLVQTGTDCNDADDTITENQTYYADTDGDTNGDVNVTTSVCSLTPPAGYVSNSNDTNDAIPNNGVEISGDEIDNDGDGIIDEKNTVAENGVHPYYSTLDPTDTATMTTAIAKIRPGKTTGKIVVTFEDDSKYIYTVFEANGKKPTKFQRYNSTGYVVVLLPQAKHVTLFNLLTGTAVERQTLKTNAAKIASLKLLDVRKDDSLDVVVTTKHNNKVQLSLLKVNLNTPSLTLKDQITTISPHAAVLRTTANAKGILLQNKDGKVLQVVPVSKDYKFTKES